MLIKKETNFVVSIALNNTEKNAIANYSKKVSDHCVLELTKDTYFLFCQSTKDGFIKFNGRKLFVGEIEYAIRQECGNYNNDIIIKYCCDYSNKIGSVLSNKCWVQPMFKNNEIGYGYNNNILNCYNVA